MNRLPHTATLPIFALLTGCGNLEKIDAADGHWAVRIVNETEQTVGVQLQSWMPDHSDQPGLPYQWELLEPGKSRRTLFWPLIAGEKADFIVWVLPDANSTEWSHIQIFEIRPSRVMLGSAAMAIDDLGVYRLKSCEGELALELERRTNALPPQSLQAACAPGDDR